jgi:hypothetical protein
MLAPLAPIKKFTSGPLGIRSTVASRFVVTSVGTRVAAIGRTGGVDDTAAPVVVVWVATAGRGSQLHAAMGTPAAAVPPEYSTTFASTSSAHREREASFAPVIVTVRVAQPGRTSEARCIEMCVPVSACSAFTLAPLAPMRWFTSGPFGMWSTTGVSLSATTFAPVVTSTLPPISSSYSPTRWRMRARHRAIASSVPEIVTCRFGAPAGTSQAG